MPEVKVKRVSAKWYDKEGNPRKAKAIYYDYKVMERIMLDLTELNEREHLVDIEIDTIKVEKKILEKNEKKIQKREMKRCD